MKRSFRQDVIVKREPVFRRAWIWLYHRDAREYINPAHHSAGARSTCARRDACERESMR